MLLRKKVLQFWNSTKTPGNSGWSDFQVLINDDDFAEAEALVKGEKQLPGMKDVIFRVVSKKL